MATIPIEIILQDAETPVDPTPTPEETNIVVPDTGAGTVGSGSTFSSSSVASTILPAILLVIALATVCAMLIHKHRKHQNSDKLSKKEKLLTAASTTIAVLSATVLVGNLVIPATNAATSVEPGTAELDVTDKITITAIREADSDEIVATVKNTSYATANLDFGYKVTASMAENATTANLYLDGDTDSPYYIAPVSDGILTDNTWGYTLSEEAEEYLAIPLADTPATIAKSNGVVEDESVDTYYAVKVDKSLPAGTYVGELEYDIAPAVEYMQDFATMTEQEKATVLANMPEGKQYVFKDSRDKKEYFVVRLKDGNIWMTQNLDHDIVATPNFYTYKNTDIGHGATPNPSATWTGTATRVTSDTAWSSSNTTPESYDLGNLYWNGALIYNKETCEANGGTWQPWGLCDNANVTSSTGDSHYHLGNYYNWTAAIAANNSEDYTSGDVDQSICPAGWRLPAYDNDKSYQNLISLQSLSAGINGNIQNSPVYFVYSGYKYTSKSSEVGSFGGYWSSVVRDGGSAYELDFYAEGSISSQSPGSRGNGYSIRCVAR